MGCAASATGGQAPEVVNSSKNHEASHPKLTADSPLADRYEVMEKIGKGELLSIKNEWITCKI